MARILFVSTDTLGDLVLREPVFRAALDAGNECALIVRKAFAECARLIAPEVKLFVLEINPYGAGADIESAAETLARETGVWKPDRIVCLLKSPNRFDREFLNRMEGVIRHVFTTTPATRLAWMQARVTARSRAPIPAEHVITTGEDDPETDAYAALIRSLGWSETIAGSAPQLSPGRAEVEADLPASLGLTSGSYVVSSPEGTQNVKLKSWPSATLAPTVAYLREKYGLRTVFIGMPGEEPALRKAAEGCSAIVWIGGEGRLAALCALLRHSAGYVGTDTGPMHLAAAIGIPIFGLFGGGTWGRFFPAARRRVIVTEKLPCFGCEWDCVLGTPHCLTDIPFERIREGLDQLFGTSDEACDVLLGGDASPGCAALIARMDSVLVSEGSILAKKKSGKRRPSFGEWIRETDWVDVVFRMTGKKRVFADFSIHGDSDSLIGASGLSHREDWGAWTESKEVTLKFPMVFSGDVRLSIWVAHVYGRVVENPITVSMGEMQAERLCRGGNVPIRVEFPLKSPTDTLRISIPFASSPASDGKSDDQRLLGLGLSKIIITGR